MAPLRALGLALLAAIAALSVLPQPWKGRLATFGALHDLLHIAAFLAASLLTTWGVHSRKRAILTALLILSFGILLEFLQTRIYRNFFEYRDAIDDVLGALAGLILSRTSATRSRSC